MPDAIQPVRAELEPELEVKPFADKPDIADLGNFLDQTRRMVPLAVGGLFLIAFIGFLYFARPFLLPLVLALSLNLLLKPLVLGMVRFHLPESVGAALVLVSIAVLIWLGVTQFSKPVAQWINQAPDTLVTLRKKFGHLTRPAEQLGKAAEKMEDITKGPAEEKTTKVELKSSPLKARLLGYTQGFIAGSLETLVLLYFLLAAGDLFMAKLVRILPTLHDKKKAVGIIKEIQDNISRFLFTITLINSGFGMVLGLAAALMGLPHPVLWGILASLLNFIPYFGPVVGMLAFGFAGLITFNSPWHALLPALLYLGLHALESNFLTPMILGRRLTLNPVMIFISLIFWTWLWGIPGALLSIPMMMMLKVLCDNFKPLAPIGEFLGG